ncbi:hypothetical protein HNP37_003472 [Flavobacterium nitrogenifigens]|uniref:Papain-like cysteine peptidase n=2 Tax=Flavobacterium TaxID=237 RepID=A0A7W7J086_9FLAO|nr:MULTISPECIES: DUF1796 family putative cysteine peptidase [Flavobacterium]MBB4803397.1 hypothetical protein [Flavobacterium nitrogenifigens]MBB6388355.1 hypothetical protein [Flavobacterium notoginsengisoli]
MKITLKKAFKMLLPHGIVVLLKNYNTYKEKHLNRNQKEFDFDVIFSVGNFCRPAYYLKKHELRSYANPLDWMMLYSLETVVHLYETKFNDFFVNFSIDEQRDHCFLDTKNNITSIHYQDISHNNKAFSDKMKKRFMTLNKKLEKANKICFISQRNESQNIFSDFLEKMGNIYSGEITLINIKHNEEIDGIILPIKCSKKKISERLELIEYEFNDIHPNGDNESNPDSWIGNFHLWNNVIRKISLKMSFVSYLLKSDEY